jgi:hypothetical protein
MKKWSNKLNEMGTIKMNVTKRTTLKLGNKMVEIKIEKPKMIRFIDSHYNELFELQDGGQVRTIYPDREEVIRTCKYIDETHFRDQYDIYHICQFAELMEKLGCRLEIVDND